ncbi:hypothetical protein EDM58_13580 [Brevibacillus panacihumi]|uniref:Uncharacterized protein n=1 Tax=Brevibacillus panacihumi TaxID=497735 RepID=A0A3M8CQI1_9BACL|nr:hypothetical protein EDM58_13580 [Brevibacillus panacihumi]
MKNLIKSYQHPISLLFGLVASVGTMYLWALLFLDSSISVLTSILLLLPALIGLIASFVRPPLIIISFVISFPFSVYLFLNGNMYKLFMIPSLFFLISAILKCKSSQGLPWSA